MDTREALGVLGLEPGVALDDVRTTYHRLLHTHHPDIAGPGATAHTARLIEAYGILVAAHDLTEQPEPERAPPPPPNPVAGPEVTALDEDTIAIVAPAPEAFAHLYEAAGRVGDISYVDRNLGILEIIVRFEGGPSCSVVMTLQGRAHFTEVFCTMESIEAAPAPPIAPVIDALIEELAS